MQIQVNSDHNIEGHEALAAHHVSDESSHKRSQNDKRCMMEARLEGHQPIAVTHQAATLHQAVDGAVGKLTRLIESTIGRRHDKQSSRTDPPSAGSKLTEQS
jgi:ribosome-associated translation inhibitor RaiA